MPFDHVYVDAPDPLIVTDPPKHTDAGVRPIPTCGKGLDVTVTEAVEEQPFASTPVTVNTEVVVGTKGILSPGLSVPSVQL